MAALHTRAQHQFSHPDNITNLSFIHPRLFLTSLAGARELKGDLSILAFAMPFTTHYLKDHDAAYRAFVTVPDSLDVDRSTFNAVFDKAADLIKEQLDTGRSVVVHCHAGINRSVTGILAYVRKYTNLDTREMIKKIRAANKRDRATAALTNWLFEKRIMEFPRGHKGLAGGKRARRQSFKKKTKPKPKLEAKPKRKSPGLKPLVVSGERRLQQYTWR